MEDKILKVVYLSNHLLDHTQILNLSLYDQTIFYKSFKWRQPLMEDGLKILKVVYLTNHLLDQWSFQNLSITTSHERRPQNTILIKISIENLRIL
jgi:hypothetical protein